MPEKFDEEIRRKRPPGGPKRRWEDNMKLDLQDIELGLDWTDLAQDRDKRLVIVDTVRNCLQEFGEEIQRKRPPGGPKRRWENNTKLDLQDIELGRDWTDVAQDTDKKLVIVDTVRSLLFP